MARPTWKGSISFGLVNIPVALYPAEERSELAFHLIDRRNKARVRYERINEETGKPVAWEEIAKAYETDDGQYVILEDQDFKKAAVEATQTVDIERFVEQKAIDPLYFDRPYYLVRLVDSMTGKWEPEIFKDEYRDALLGFIEKKARAGGKRVPAQGKTPAGRKTAGKVVDIMDLLKKSMEQKGAKAGVARRAGSRSSASDFASA